MIESEMMVTTLPRSGRVLNIYLDYIFNIGPQLVLESMGTNYKHPNNANVDISHYSYH
jgi:hypothetical protein